MDITRLALSAAAACACYVVQPAAAHAQNRASVDARAKAAFGAFDLNESGWLSGREITACDCRSYDSDRNGEITWDEFRAGWARAPLFGDGAAPRGREVPQAATNPPLTQRPAPANTAGKYSVADRVQVSVDGSWHSATVIQVRNGEYRLARDDRAYGVASSEEWIAENRLRPFVDTPTPARPPTSNLPSSVPTGSYACTTYQTGGGANVGELHVLGGNVSSGVTRDGSGPQHKFTYDATTGAIAWEGGLQIAGFTVERAEYRPGTDGKPNINLHYRRQAGDNLNSMSCTRR